MNIATSEAIDQISTALAKAQARISTVGKDAKNPHFKSQYATLAAVREAAIPALNDHGISVLQFPGYLDGRVTLTTRLLHTGGQWIDSTCSAKSVKDDAQGFGSVVTYLRRYSLAAITGLAQDDDDGEGQRRANQRPLRHQPEPEKPATEVDISTHLNGFEAAETTAHILAVRKQVRAVFDQLTPEQAEALKVAKESAEARVLG